MLNCLAIDDDDIYLAVIGELMDRHPGVENFGCFNSVREASAQLDSGRVDLILLDIEMPEEDGIQYVRAAGRIPQVIFVTAHQDYAAEAFEYDVTDYIVKPVHSDRFNAAIERASKIHNYERVRRSDQHILIKASRKLIRVRVRDISVVEADGDYINVWTGDRCHVTLGSLNDMQVALGQENYMRTHRGYLIRLDGVDSVEGYRIVMQDGREAKVSRNVKADLLRRLKSVG